jgi:DNA modification methylase
VIPFYTDPLVTLLHGDCIQVMAGLEADSVDAVVTDPPYGLEFMGKEWDGPALWDGRRNTEAAKIPGGGSIRNAPTYKAGPGFQAWCEQWGREALRVTKPGGYLLAFGGTRTHHRLVCALEDAGWIIRDELDWIYASGFPKGKANLKPAHEPIVLARKPGPLRPLGIDETRIPAEPYSYPNGPKGNVDPSSYNFGRIEEPVESHPAGRWPSNVLLSSPELFDEPNPEIVGSGATSDSGEPHQVRRRATSLYEGGWASTDEGFAMGGSGGYSRFFIIPKADRAERERGLAEIALRLHRDSGECDKLGAWERPAPSPSELTDSSSPERATSDAPPAEDSGSSSDTSSLGKPLTGQSPRATRSTTSTETSRTTPSPTSSSLTPQPTSESTPGASLSMGFGGSRAPSASSFDPSSPSGGTSLRKGGLSTADADPATSERWGRGSVCADCGKPLPRGSSHPTVKPIDLMRHLVRLVTPPGGTVLDPFLGSGTTALAASELGIKCIGIEREAEYLSIAVGRLMATPLGLGLFEGDDRDAA